MNINFLGVGLGGISKIAPHDTQGLQRAFVLTKRSKDFRREIVLLQIIYRNRYGRWAIPPCMLGIPYQE